MAEHTPTPSEPWKANSDLRRYLDVITTIALGVMAVVVLYRNLGTSPKTESASAPRIAVPSKPVDLGPDRMGRLSSPVGIVVFSDFECTYCADFANTKLPLILRSYVDVGKVIVGFRHFPNESSHRSALGAARASACASEQGRFWPFHDRLFANSTALDSNSLRKVALDVGVGEDAFNSCLSGSGGPASTL